MSDNKKTQSVHLRLDKDFLEEIENFSSEYRFKSRTDALRFLIATGLKYHETAKDLIERKDVK